MMFMCIKQRLSNIWSSIHEKVKELKKKTLLIKKACSCLEQQKQPFRGVLQRANLSETIKPQIFSCKFCEFFKFSSFNEDLWVAAFVKKFFKIVKKLTGWIRITRNSRPSRSHRKNTCLKFMGVVLKSLLPALNSAYPEVYSEPTWRFKKELFVKIVSGF